MEPVPDLSQRADAGYQQRRFSDFELRAADGDDTWTFEGVASTVDHPYEVRDFFGTFTETIAAGAFDQTLKTNDRIALYAQHNWQHGAIPMANVRAGTLSLTADPHLRVTAQLDPSRPDVQTMRSAITRGELTEMSIGFADVKGGVEWNDDYTERTVTELALREVSVVDEGANDRTLASIRSWVNHVAARDVDMNETEIRRAIHCLQKLLADGHADTPTDGTPDPVVEAVTGSGLVVSDQLLELWAKKRPDTAAA